MELDNWTTPRQWSGLLISEDQSVDTVEPINAHTALLHCVKLCAVFAECGNCYQVSSP